jgi:LPS sulfotransferase NodH
VAGYLVCGTPRTGSTLLCSLLASTGVLGRPQSWFRQPDEARLSAQLGVAHDGTHARDFAEYAEAVRRAATTSNGVTAARVMWGSLERLPVELARPGETAAQAWERVLGVRTFVHLSRQDTVGQAVSWFRAEQTGFWQQGDVAVGPLAPDVEAMAALSATIEQHERAWRAWFDRQGVVPLSVTYEELVADPGQVAEDIADSVGVPLPRGWRPVLEHERQADATNEEWAALLRARLSPPRG